MPKVRFTADEKARTVMRHLQNGVPISAICSEMSIHPNLFYIWQKQLFAGAVSVFENKGQGEQRLHERKVAELEKSIRGKDSVIAELLEEYTALKKRLGCVRGMGKILSSGSDCRLHGKMA